MPVVGTAGFEPATPAPKPDRTGALPAETVNSTGYGRDGVVRGCPVGTRHDRCGWHAGGTAGEDDLAHLGAVGSHLDRRVRSIPGDRLPRWQGPPARGSRQVGFEPAVFPLHVLWSSAGMRCDLGFLHTGRDRWCPPRTSRSRCHADPARTRRSARRGAPMPLAPPDRRCRYGQLSRPFSNSTVTVPSACRVICTRTWPVILEPSEPSAWKLKVAVEVKLFWLLRFAPAQNVDLAV
jgi:hypothetical protein